MAGATGAAGAAKRLAAAVISGDGTAFRDRSRPAAGRAFATGMTAARNRLRWTPARQEGLRALPWRVVWLVSWRVVLAVRES